MHDANPLKFVGRRVYAWAMVFFVVVAPAVELVVFQLVPGLERYSRFPNTAIFVCVVLLTGARLADAGYRRWIGITVMLAIGIGFPAMAALAYPAAFRVRIPDQAAPLIVLGIGMLLALAFVVWAGTRKSVARGYDPGAPALDDGLGDTRTESRRIEPHF